MQLTEFALEVGEHFHVCYIKAVISVSPRLYHITVDALIIGKWQFDALIPPLGYFQRLWLSNTLEAIFMVTETIRLFRAE